MKPKVFAVIPARAGSKRLPGKNWKPFAGKSLVGYAVEVAQKCREIDHIIISSDYIKHWDGCQIHEREEEDATSSAEFPPIITKIVHEDCIVVLLQPTSPLRAVQDIEAGLALYQPGHSVISVVKLNPWTLMINGAIYIAHIDILRRYRDFVNPIYYLMPKRRSIDIDTQEDWNMAEALAKRNVL